MRSYALATVAALAAFAATLGACGATNPNQPNYDRIQQAYAKEHGGDHGAGHGPDHAEKPAGAAGAHADGTAPAGGAAHADGAGHADGGGHGASAGDPDAGAKVYSTYCVACHGPDGKGMNGLAANLAEDKTRLAKEDAVLIKNIREGYSGSIGVMPPWGSVVDEKGAKDVIAYLRREYQK
jgi:mono/diheme cytochrome c family protein